MLCTSASNSTGGVVKSVHVSNKKLGLVFFANLDDDRIVLQVKSGCH